MFNFYVNVKTVVNGVEHQNGSSLQTIMQDARELFNEHGETVTGEIVLMSGNDIFYNPLGQPTVEEFRLIEKGGLARDLACTLWAYVGTSTDNGEELDPEYMQSVLLQLRDLL